MLEACGEYPGSNELVVGHSDCLIALCLVLLHGQPDYFDHLQEILLGQLLFVNFGNNHIKVLELDKILEYLLGGPKIANGYYNERQDSLGEFAAGEDGVYGGLAEELKHCLVGLEGGGQVFQETYCLVSELLPGVDCELLPYYSHYAIARIIAIVVGELGQECVMVKHGQASQDFQGLIVSLVHHLGQNSEHP